MKIEERLCIGTAQFGMAYGIANKTGKVAPQSALEIVRSALESGVDHFDTAQDYGDSEETLGYAIKELTGGQKVKVVTKLSSRLLLTEAGSIEAAVRKSLSKLNVSSLWGLLLHHAPATIAPSTRNQIAALKLEGLVKEFGVSVYDPADALRFLYDESVDAVQLPFNIFDRRWIDQRVFELAKEKRKKVYIRSVYLQGLLFLTAKEMILKKMGWADRYVENFRAFVAAEHISPAVFALHAVIRECPDADIVIGIESVKQLRENLAMLNDRSITTEMIKRWWNGLPPIPQNLVNPSLWSGAPRQRIVAVIQARMGSTRLPGKVLLPILGRSMLSHIVERLRKVVFIDEVVVATSTHGKDDQIASLCRDERIKCHRGSEEDVLDRFYHAAREEQADHVIRVTADCPLIDPAIIENLVVKYFSGGYDHCGVATGAGAAMKGFTERFPDGLDTEIFSFSSLELAWKESTKAIHREHVTTFIWQQPDRFNIGMLKSDIDYSDIRLTVDNAEDFVLIRWIYDELHPVNPSFGLQEVMSLLHNHAEKMNMNRQYVGKEGYEEFGK